MRSLYAVMLVLAFNVESRIPKADPELQCALRGSCRGVVASMEVWDPGAEVLGIGDNGMSKEKKWAAREGMKRPCPLSQEMELISKSLLADVLESTLLQVASAALISDPELDWLLRRALSHNQQF